MSTPCKFATAAEAKKGNWFSRRHQSSGPHQDAHNTREARITGQFQDMQARVAKQDAAAAARKEKAQ